MLENCRRQHCQLRRARNAYLHVRPPISTSSIQFTNIIQLFLPVLVCNDVHRHCLTQYSKPLTWLLWYDTAEYEIQ